MLSFTSLFRTAFSWTSFSCSTLLEINRFQLESRLDSVKECLVNAGWVEQEHVLVQGAVAQEDCPISPVTQSS